MRQKKHKFVLFFIVLGVFVLYCVFSIFRIPSSSMRPEFPTGEFLVVNKFAYGVRLPITNEVVIPTGKIQRGEVVVFYYPKDPRVPYLKRVVGLGGDIVEYRDKILTINGQLVSQKLIGFEEYSEISSNQLASITLVIKNQVFEEKIDGISFLSYQHPDSPPIYLGQVDPVFKYRDHCQYSLNGFICKVPSGQYFMMGDNRDNSGDSRYWGFVEENHIMGKVVWHG